MNPLAAPSPRTAARRKGAGWGRRAWNTLRLLGAAALLLAACQPAAGLLPPTPQPTATPPAQIPTPQLSPTPAPTTVSTQILTVWVPPGFDPRGQVRGADVLLARIRAFEDQNPGVQVKIRVKAPNGPGGLLESLSAATLAAPEALPSLVLLSRTDLETAALKGLVFPLDDLTAVMDEPDWFAYAAQLASLDGSVFGLPFAGDALLLLYRAEKVGSAPVQTWDDVMSRGQPLIFPAGDPQALMTLALYRSLDGPLEDELGRPALDPVRLAQVFSLYAEGAQQGAFPYWLGQFQTDGQAWQGYREPRGTWVVTWSSRYLAELPVDTAAAELPSLGDHAYTLATGWLWAMPDPHPERREMAVRLAEFLTASEFQQEWSAAAGYLPTRPSALAAWNNQSLQSMLNQAALSAETRPANDLVASIGPVLQEAVLQVIKSQSDPLQAAEAAAERLRETQSP